MAASIQTSGQPTAGDQKVAAPAAAAAAPQGAGTGPSTIAPAAQGAAGTPPSTNCCSGFFNSALSAIKASFTWALQMLTYVVTCGCFCGSSNNNASQNGGGTPTP